MTKKQITTGQALRAAQAKEEARAQERIRDAGPELLEALEKANDLIASLTAPNGMPVSPVRIEEVRRENRTAIAKARNG